MKELHLLVIGAILQIIPANSFPLINRNVLNLNQDMPNMYTGHGLFAPNSNIYPGSYNSPSSTGYNQRGKVYGSNTYQNKPDQTPGNSHPNSYQKQQSGHYQNAANMNYNTNTYGHTPNGYTLPVQNSKGNYGNIYSQIKPPLKRFGKPQKKKFYWPYFPYSASDYGNPLYKKGNEHKKDLYDKGEKYSDVPYEGHMYNSAKKFNRIVRICEVSY